MKFYYNDVGYDLKWKLKHRQDDVWYNMEIGRINVKLPLNLYNTIKSDILLSVEDSYEIQTDGIFNFKILKYENEDTEFRRGEFGLWYLSTFIERMSYSAKFKDGLVIAHFDFVIYESKKLEHSEFRNLILNEII